MQPSCVRRYHSLRLYFESHRNFAKLLDLVSYLPVIESLLTSLPSFLIMQMIYFR